MFDKNPMNQAKAWLLRGSVSVHRPKSLSAIWQMDTWGSAWHEG